MSDFHGQLSLHAEPRDGGATVLARQAFRAPFHLSKPYFDPTTRTLLAQVVNPTAGILSGDRLESDVTVAPGAALLVTTPSASRVFRMRDGEATAEQHFTVEPGGWLEVLPEPLVPHRGSRFTQRTSLTVAPGGAAFYADLLMPGRLAHGERWSWDALLLELSVHAGADLVLRERLAHDGASLHALSRLAGTGDDACLGNAVLIAPEADPGATPAWRDALHALQTGGVWIGASPLHRDAGWSIKFVAPDGPRLRDTLREIRRILASVAPHLACDPRKL